MTLTRRALFVSTVLVCALGAAPPLSANDPLGEKVVFTGASAAGSTSITFSGSKYTFAFAGDETLIYTLDLADPKVAGAMLRIREMVSDSYPVDGLGVFYRDPAGLYYPPKITYPKCTLTGHAVTGNKLTLNYVMDYNGSHPIRYEITQEKKALRIRVTDPTGNVNLNNNFAGSLFGDITGVEVPKPIHMQGTLAQPMIMFRKATPNGNDHYFTSNILDLLQSSSVDYGINNLMNPKYGADWATTSFHTQKLYEPMSNNKLAAPLDDTYIVIVTGRIKDALLDTTAPPSPYLPLMSSRMFFNAPSQNWSLYGELFDLYQSLGMNNLVGYFFGSSGGADDPPAQENYGPDWVPAYNEPAFKAMVQKAVGYGVSCAAYTAYNCMPATAPAGTWDPSHIARDAAGNAKTYFGLGFPMLACEAAGLHMQAEAPKLKALGLNACFVDSQTFSSVSKASDGDHIDQTAGSPWSKTMKQGAAAQKVWFDQMRASLGGPLMGEGSISDVNSNMEYLWFGYVDSVQRCINSGTDQAWELPAGSPTAPTNWPIVPEYEWRVVAQRQVNHGNATYDRFFGKSDGSGVVNMTTGMYLKPLTQEAHDLYRAFLITYGHAGDVMTNGIQLDDEGYITHAGAAQDYFMTNALQLFYFTAPIADIRYWYGGSFQTFEQVLFATETLDTFRHIPIRLDFLNGLRIWVNHGSTPLAISTGGATFTLPAKTGWYATLPGWIEAFSAIPATTGGKRIDYCKATGQYEYFNGRGQVSGYGGLSTASKRSKWTVPSSGLTVTEDAAGILTPVQAAAPALTKIVIVPQSNDVGVGDRVGLRAAALFSNGSLRDVTTLVTWYAANGGVASVNQNGVLTALGSGVSKIHASAPGGTLFAAPLTVTVHP